MQTFFGFTMLSTVQTLVFTVWIITCYGQIKYIQYMLKCLQYRLIGFWFQLQHIQYKLLEIIYDILFIVMYGVILVQYLLQYVTKYLLDSAAMVSYLWYNMQPNSLFWDIIEYLLWYSIYSEILHNMVCSTRYHIRQISFFPILLQYCSVINDTSMICITQLISILPPKHLYNWPISFASCSFFHWCLYDPEISGMLDKI